LIYDVLLDALKERLGEFRVLFFKRFKTKRNVDQFLEESRILNLYDLIQTLFKLRRSVISTMKPRTVEEIILDHRPINEINLADIKDISSKLKTTRLEEKWEQELEGVFGKMDKRLEQKSEEVDNISNLKRLLLQFHSKAEMENPEFVRMHTKSAKVVDAILDQTLERWFGADIDLTLLAFNFEAEKNKFLGK
jgi:Na+/phosphate symporter